ncbi:MAG TPA: sigma 54-interacting transcriptional regulator [Candidatus Acidoferrum sp.]|nr:sigma 54-interacting transcriptional regulator [Candidatus Acidoferrum sp.]
MGVDDVRTGTWVTFVGGSASSIQVRRCRLVVVSGPDQGAQAEVESTWIRVGAQSGCDLVLRDRLVSGHHFEILVDEAGYRLRDLDSTNGTFIAGHRVRDAYLNPGTVIYVGESRLRFEPLDQSVTVELSRRDRFGDMVGSSVAMRALYARLERLAPTDASVLITGETGTGKELVAEALHQHSSRSAGPFVVVDCGSIPDNLIASELFGHERGAFTGAFASYAGAFERAHCGTIFLDEIGELPLELQPNMLGVLERRHVRRLGGSRNIPLDLRVIAATNRDLASEVNRGTFRSDLYYRLAVVQVRVPPLRERADDIPLLAEHFLELLGTGGTRAPRLSRETLDSLRQHRFPGNVRELRNLLERSVILAELGVEPDGQGLVAELRQEPGGGEEPERERQPDPEQDRQRGRDGSGGEAPAGGEGVVARPATGEEASGPSGQVVHMEVDAAVPYRIAKQRLVAAFDARYLRQLLRRHGGNVSRAARAAGLDRMTVHKMLQRVGLGGWRSRALDDD